jgi:hypothetical protein
MWSTRLFLASDPISTRRRMASARLGWSACVPGKHRSRDAACDAIQNAIEAALNWDKSAAADFGSATGKGGERTRAG